MINPGEKITMTLKEKDLKQIGDYVQKKLPLWLDSLSFPRSIQAWDMELRERVVRVEEELKNQRELMKQGFEQMDKRFEQVDKRFEQFEKRFTIITVLISTGFTMVTVLISIFKFIS